jgi:hypothetical protein
MKNKCYNSLLAVFMLFTFACKKSSNGTTDAPTTKPKKYLTHTITVATTPGANGTTTTTNTYYTYDSQKRLSTVKTGDKTNTYAYYDDGNIYTITKTDATLPTRSVTEFTYADGKLKQYTIRSYNGATLLSENPYVYVYNGDRVSEIHYSTYYEKYTYDQNGNVLNIYHDEGASYYTYYFFYDDKKSMFINSLIKYPTVSTIAGFVEGYVTYPYTFFSFDQNNISSVSNDSLGKNVTESYKYNYDDDGYPTSGVYTENIINVTTIPTKYTFEYSTLQ